MQDTKRLFIAIKMNVELQNAVSDLIAKNTFLSHEKSMRWIAIENLHLTLHFLGDTKLSEIQKIKQVMDETVVAFQKFDLDFVGLGCFPTPKRPRVLWMGLEAVDDLKLLYNRLMRNLMQHMPVEKPRFSPHVTIARMRDKLNPEALSGISTLLEQNQDIRFGKMQVKEITLFESILQKTGPIYKPCHHSMLK